MKDEFDQNILYACKEFSDGFLYKGRSWGKVSRAGLRLGKGRSWRNGYKPSETKRQSSYRLCRGAGKPSETPHDHNGVKEAPSLRHAGVQCGALCSVVRALCRIFMWTKETSMFYWHGFLCVLEEQTYLGTTYRRTNGVVSSALCSFRFYTCRLDEPQIWNTGGEEGKHHAYDK